MAAESALQVLRSLDERRRYPAACLIAGAQVFLREYLFDRLRQRLGQGGLEYRGFQVGAGSDFGAVINELRAPGLFAAASVIGCRVSYGRRQRGSDGDPAGDEAKASGGEAALAEAVERMSGPGHLILLFERDTAPAKIRRVIERSGLLVNCPRPFDNQLPEYVAHFARLLGIGLSREAADFIVARYGSDLAAAANALQQASIRCEDGAPIEVTALHESGSRRTPELFDLADSLAHGQAQSAIGVFDRAVTLGRDPFELLAVEIIPALRRMMLAGSLLEKGQSAAEVAQAFGVSPYSPLVTRSVEGARRFGPRALWQAYRSACELDVKFKMGLVKGREQAISALILELFAEGKLPRSAPYHG